MVTGRAYVCPKLASCNTKLSQNSESNLALDTTPQLTYNERRYTRIVVMENGISGLL